MAIRHIVNCLTACKQMFAVFGRWEKEIVLAVNCLETSKAIKKMTE